MKKAIEVLMEEHRLIKRVLEALYRYAKNIDNGTAPDRGTIALFAEFFREFSDKCHHGKEEAQLFRMLAARGFSTEVGPLAVMLHEHEEGRSRVRTMAETGEKEGDLSEEEKSVFIENARGFFDLMTEHIKKEDNILYPMAEKVISDANWDLLEEAFERFEKEEVGEGRLNELRALAEKLAIM
jgi:hemerythrin-like domain-containing protein